MKLSRLKTALGAGLLATTMLASACTPETAPANPTTTKTFKATSVTVNDAQDSVDCGFFDKCDEPGVLNVGFRVKLGVANSAVTNVAVGKNAWPGVFDQGLKAGQSHTYTGDQQGAITFANVSSPDLINLPFGAPIEVVGYWAWKIEDDGIIAANVSNMANAIATALTPVLNQTVAAGTVPSDMNQLVSTVLNAIMNMGFFNLVGTGLTAALNNLNISSDDVMGSAMYIGIGSSGALADIVRATAGQVQFPAIAIPALTVPPDIGGGAIFPVTDNKTFVDASTNGGVSGKHTTTYTYG